MLKQSRCTPASRNIIMNANLVARAAISARTPHLGRASRKWPSPSGTTHADPSGRQVILSEHRAHNVEKDSRMTESQKNFQNVQELKRSERTKPLRLGRARFHALIRRKFHAVAEPMARAAILRGISH